MHAGFKKVLYNSYIIISATPIVILIVTCLFTAATSSAAAPLLLGRAEDADLSAVAHSMR